MITVEWLPPSAVRVYGLSSAILPPARWYHALMASGATLQRIIRDHYANERGFQLTAVERFKGNSPKWNQTKARKGWDHRLGNQLGRIQRALNTEQLYSVSDVTGGSAVITLNETVLREVAPHALFYARSKIRGGRVLQIAPAWVRLIGARLQQIHAEAEAQHRRKSADNAARKNAFERDIATAERNAYLEDAQRNRAENKAAESAERLERQRIADVSKAERAAYIENARRAGVPVSEKKLARLHLKAMDEQGILRVDPTTDSVTVEWTRARSFKRRTTLASTAWRAARQVEKRLRRL